MYCIVLNTLYLCLIKVKEHKNKLKTTKTKDHENANPIIPGNK